VSAKEPRARKPYALYTTPTVRRALADRLPRAIAAAAYTFITGPLLQEPYRVGKRLMPPLNDRFSARRGTYWVIYRIHDTSRSVTVVDIDHRRDVYHR
jgi:mRNA interferase RelE/StbE